MVASNNGKPDPSDRSKHIRRRPVPNTAHLHVEGSLIESLERLPVVNVDSGGTTPVQSAVSVPPRRANEIPSETQSQSIRSATKPDSWRRERLKRFEDLSWNPTSSPPSDPFNPYLHSSRTETRAISRGKRVESAHLPNRSDAKSAKDVSKTDGRISKLSSVNHLQPGSASVGTQASLTTRSKRVSKGTSFNDYMSSSRSKGKTRAVSFSPEQIPEDTRENSRKIQKGQDTIDLPWLRKGPPDEPPHPFEERPSELALFDEEPNRQNNSGLLAVGPAASNSFPARHVGERSSSNRRLERPDTLQQQQPVRSRDKVRRREAGGMNEHSRSRKDSSAKKEKRRGEGRVKLEKTERKKSDRHSKNKHHTLRVKNLPVRGVEVQPSPPSSSTSRRQNKLRSEPLLYESSSNRPVLRPHAYDVPPRSRELWESDLIDMYGITRQEQEGEEEEKDEKEDNVSLSSDFDTGTRFIQRVQNNNGVVGNISQVNPSTVRIFPISEDGLSGDDDNIFETQQVVYRDCAVCGDSMEDEKQYFPNLSRCTHPSWTCAACYATWIEKRLEESGWSKVKCPEHKCDVVLTYFEIQRYATEDVFLRYDGQIARAVLSQDRMSIPYLSYPSLPVFPFPFPVSIYLMKTSLILEVRLTLTFFFFLFEHVADFQWCRNCNNGQIHVLGDEQDNMLFTCHECGYQVCLMHDNTCHEGETCEEYEDRVLLGRVGKQKEKEREARRQEEEASLAAIDRLSKKCPGPGCVYNIVSFSPLFGSRKNKSEKSILWNARPPPLSVHLFRPFTSD